MAAERSRYEASLRRFALRLAVANGDPRATGYRVTQIRACPACCPGMSVAAALVSPQRAHCAGCHGRGVVRTVLATGEGN